MSQSLRFPSYFSVDIPKPKQCTPSLFLPAARLKHGAPPETKLSNFPFVPKSCCICVVFNLHLLTFFSLSLRRTHPYGELLAAALRLRVLISPSHLREHAVDLVLVLEFEHLGRLIALDAISVEQKSEAAGVHALSLGVRSEYLLHLGGLLDLKPEFGEGQRADENGITTAEFPVETLTTGEPGRGLQCRKGCNAERRSRNESRVVRVNLPVAAGGGPDGPTHMVSSPVWSLTRIVMGSLPSGLASSASLILTNLFVVNPLLGL